MAGALSQLSRSNSSSITLEVSRLILSGVSNFGLPTTVNTRFSTTVLASGGVPPYTYNWTSTSGSADIFATSPSSPTTYFAAFFLAHGTKSGDWKCTVTDSAANSVDSTLVTIGLTSRNTYNYETP
jgi:hypothetical protein